MQGPSESPLTRNLTYRDRGVSMTARKEQMRRSVTDRILERLDVRAFYSQYTKLSEPSQKGECRGLCPLHEEKTPSFCVNVNSASFNCFGCGKGGGPIQFYAAIKNVSVFEASAELLRMYGQNGNGRPSTSSRKPAPERQEVAPPADVVPPASAVTQADGRDRHRARQDADADDRRTLGDPPDAAHRADRKHPESGRQRPD